MAKIDRKSIEAWFIKNKIIAIGAPIIIIFLIYFVNSSFTKLSEKNVSTKKEGYNNSLPFKEKKSTVENPHELYKERLKDSISNSYSTRGNLKSLKKRQQEKDSFSKVLTNLKNFSFKEAPKKKNKVVYTKKTIYPSKKETKTNINNKENINSWRERIKKENDAFFNSPSANFDNKKDNNQSENSLRTDSEILAVIYRDQNAINNGRVLLRLSKDVYINGLLYKRNTLFHGFTKFAKNRIYININKINNSSVNLSAYDTQDYNIGIYTEVKFNNLTGKDTQRNVIDQVETNNSKIGNTVKSIFRKIKKIDKVFLHNETKLILKTN